MTLHTKDPEAVVEAYALGTRTRDISLLKSIFHDDAVMTGWLGPDFLCGGPQPFLGALEANEVGDNYTSETVDVRVFDKIASAETRETNLLGLSFTNHFHMAQLSDGTWRITSKLFKHG
ncbi:MAG: nuclear transport factor 2 family protein [Pseudomonadota bacterium]